MHFMDNVAEMHETMRKMALSPELAWLAREMRPITDLCLEEHAHMFVRGLTLSHMDAILKRDEKARRFLVGDLEAELAARGIDAKVHNP